MWKKWLACLTIALMIPSALAEVYTGTTVAKTEQTVEVESSGVLEVLNVEAGDVVEAGDIIGSLRANKVYASQDGTVALIEVDEGESVSGTVLEIMPETVYHIYCTVEGGYEDEDTTLMHAGEIIYVKCSTNSTHRAIGIVIEIDNLTYELIVIGGELYIGEVVDLYRDDDFSSSECVGVGTVVSEDTVVYQAEGTILEMCVSVGEEVESGELLYTYIDGDSAEVVSDWTGIVTSVSVSQGDSVEENQTLATVATFDSIRVQIQVEESTASVIQVGDEATVYLADDPDEEISGTVESISMVADEQGLYTVLISTDVQIERLGMTAEVYIDTTN